MIKILKHYCLKKKKTQKILIYLILTKKYETNEKYKNEDNYHLTKGKIILNWHMCLGVVPIIGTLKQNRMKENLAAKSFTLDEKMIDLISSEQRQFRFNDGSDVFGIDIFA